MWMPSIEESGIGWSLTLKYSILFWMFKPLDCKFTARLNANVVSYNSRVKIKKNSTGNHGHLSFLTNFSRLIVSCDQNGAWRKSKCFAKGKIISQLSSNLKMKSKCFSYTDSFSYN